MFKLKIIANYKIHGNTPLWNKPVLHSRYCNKIRKRKMQNILLWIIYFYWIIPFILCCLLTGCKKHFIMHTDCSRDNDTQTKSGENVSIVRLQWQGKPNLSPWCLTNFCEGNLIQILMRKKKKNCITWPEKKVLPLYSTGSNGLPLAKIARPFKCRTQET